MKIAAITCARMDSIRFPGKCLTLLNGKSLLQYTIDFAKTIDIQHFIWTRDLEIMEFVGQQIPILFEPQYLYDTRENTTYEKMQYANRILKCDYLILLQPTHPVRNKKEIEGWIQHFTFAPGNGYGYTMEYTGDSPDGAFYIYSKEYLEKGIGIIQIYKQRKCFDINNKEDLEECAEWLQKHDSSLN
jgi:CMP-N-acetylneuraminic acid synthetase